MNGVFVVSKLKKLHSSSGNVNLTFPNMNRRSVCAWQLCLSITQYVV